MKAVKLKALHDNRSLQDTIALLLRRGLEAPEKSATARVKLPLIYCEAAPPEQEITPEKAAEILLGQELDDLIR